MMNELRLQLQLIFVLLFLASVQFVCFYCFKVLDYTQSSLDVIMLIPGLIALTIFGVSSLLLSLLVLLRIVSKRLFDKFLELNVEADYHEPS